MSHLSKLKLSTRSPHQELSPVERKRRTLLERLDKQIVAAEAALRGEELYEHIPQRVAVEGSDETQMTTRTKPFRRWWWTNDTGQVMVSLRAGNKVLEVEPGKPAIEVGWLEDLPDTLRTLRAAVADGELDAQLEKAVTRLSDVGKGKTASKK